MSNQIKVQVIFTPQQLTIDLDTNIEILIQFKCGSHSVLSKKSNQLCDGECYFQSQQLEIVTSMKMKNGKFKEKEAKVRIILLHKNNYKKGGKIKFDLSQYMNQRLHIVDDKMNLLNCPDKNASLSFQIQFKQAIQTNNKLQTESKITIPTIQAPSITHEIKLHECQNCKMLQEQIKQLNSQYQSESQRSTLSQRDSLQQSKFLMLENEIKCQYQIERELKTIIEILELELLKQKKIVAQIMQEFLQLGDPKLIEIVENVVQCN